MDLILISHLKTTCNEKRHFIGITDEELSEQEVLNFKQKYKIDSYPQVEQVIVSPMKRCIQTAELIYPKNQITQEELLKECDFGIFEGKTYEDLKDRAEYQAWLDSGGTIAFPEGEEQKEFRSRCVRGMLRQVDRLCKENVESAAFVVHGGTIMAVLEQLAEEQKDFYHWQVENGGGYRTLVNEDEWNSGIHRFRKIQKLGGAIE